MNDRSRGRSSAVRRGRSNQGGAHLSKHDAVAQNALTVVLPIREGGVDALRETLQLLRAHEGGIEENPFLPFGRLTGAHFTRFVVMERSLDANEDLRRLRRPLLALSSNHDGDDRAHVTELAQLGAPWLHDVLTHCEGYSRPAPDVGAIVAFLLEHRVPYAAFHVGAVGLSVAQIRDEAALREKVECFLDARARAPALDALEAWDVIAEHLRGGPFAWALEPSPKRGFWSTLPQGSVPRALRLVARASPLLLPFGLLAAAWAERSTAWLVAAVVLVLVYGTSLVAFRRAEATDPVFSRTRYDARAQDLAAREDKIVQNQMTILADVKRGWLRSYVLRTVFAVINTLGRLVYRKGRLGSIATIHFARWVILEEERAVLFFSNYTGSWEQYLGDFVDRASVGLTAVWSNTVRYPRTRRLVLDGAKDEQRFKAWARAQQMETDLWYSAYKGLSMANILNNHAIRVGLQRRPTRRQAENWLRRL